MHKGKHSTNHNYDSSTYNIIPLKIKVLQNSTKT